MLPGKRVKVVKWIHGARCVVRVDVEAIIPDAAPDQPFLEPATVKWLDALQRLADEGDAEALSKAAASPDVYVRRSA